MLSFAATAFLEITQKLSYLESSTPLSPDLANALVSVEASKNGKLFREAENCCAEVGLTMSAKYLERIRQSIEQGITYGDLGRKLTTLRDMISDEMGEHGYFCLPKPKNDLYNELTPFGPDVHQAFPAIAIDVEEAAKCLAVGRHTASVFHLMRVMEAIIPEIGSRLSVTVNPNDWSAMLDQLRRGLKDRETAKQIGLKEKRYAWEVVTHFDAVRIAWRNPTMHVTISYDEEKATDVFNSVRTFVRYLAQPVPAI